MMFVGCSAFNFCLYTMRKGNWSLKDEKGDFYASIHVQTIFINPYCFHKSYWCMKTCNKNLCTVLQVL